MANPGESKKKRSAFAAALEERADKTNKIPKPNHDALVQEYWRLCNSIVKLRTIEDSAQWESAFLRNREAQKQLFALPVEDFTAEDLKLEHRLEFIVPCACCACFELSVAETDTPLCSACCEYLRPELKTEINKLEWACK